MQDDGYRIIKLKNGDNIICKIIDTKKKTLVLERPMQYKSIHFVDPTSLSNNEMLVFKTWIDYSTDRIIEICVDGILAISSPDIKLIKCYEMEKEKEDTVGIEPNDLKELDPNILNSVIQQQGLPKSNNLPPENINVTFNVPPEMAEEIIEMMAEAKSWEDLDEELEDEDLFPEVKPPKKKTNKKKPNNPASKHPPQKKNKKDPKEFGNDYTDWSPDPKDYI